MENELRDEPIFENRTQEREWLLQHRVDEAVGKVYQLLFAEDLAGDESKLGWLLVIEKMLQSEVSDRRAAVTSEWRGLNHA